jgi:hypothetical protein
LAIGSELLSARIIMLWVSALISGDWECAQSSGPPWRNFCQAGGLGARSPVIRWWRIGLASAIPAAAPTNSISTERVRQSRRNRPSFGQSEFRLIAQLTHNRVEGLVAIPSALTPVETLRLLMIIRVNVIAHLIGIMCGSKLFVYLTLVSA